MIVFPSPLKPGDTIGLIAPSFPIKEEELKDCIALLEAMGYHVKVGGEAPQSSPTSTTILLAKQRSALMTSTRCSQTRR